jgi:hypothetical protein
MAGAEYVKHVKGSALRRGMVLVFQNYYVVLGAPAGYVTRRDPLSGDVTKEKVKFNVERFNRDGSGKVKAVDEFRLAVDFPLGRLVK